MRKTLRLAAGLLIGCLSACGQADAAQTVKLHVRFSPNRPNASTTIHFGFHVAAADGGVPSPVTGVALALPTGMGLGLMTLGEAICTSRVLETDGPSGCPPNAVMGVGQALIELPVGNEKVRNTAALKIFMGTPIDRHTVMLFDAVSVRPVSTEILFPGQLVQNPSGSGASLDTLIPAIPSWPEGAYASVVTMQSTLGPEHLTYFHRVHGVRTPYRPVGMAVPGVCPRRGYRFVVHVGFLDGSSATAVSHVPCHR
jgi:hypothetical protein